MKITRTFCFVFWYVLFYENLIVLQHGDIIFYSVLTSASNHTFNNNFKDEDMITSHSMWVIETVTEKYWKMMLHKNPENHPVRAKFRTLKAAVYWFYTGVLKNLQYWSFFNKVVDLLLQNTYGSSFWIFTAANTFFS